MLVLGAGPGGYSAAFRAADLGMKVVLVERYATLGGVCLNVGCIPSKALLHVAAVMDEVSHFESLGVSFGKPAGRPGQAARAQGQGGGQADRRPGRHGQDAQGHGGARRRASSSIRTTCRWRKPAGAGQEKTGKKQTVKFRNCIIAAGSQAVQLPFMPKDPRIVDSTGALELAAVPKRMLILGGGIIGLEMGTVYSTLGARLDVVEMLDGLMQGADRDLVRVWQKMNAPRFDNIMLKTKTVGAEATKDGILVKFEGEQAPKEPQLYDLVLQAVGRSPNGKKIGAEKAGVTVDDRGFIPVDIQMRTNVPHIFAIGDIVGQPMLAHKAVHEAHVAAEVAAGENVAFNARVIPSVAYTDPEIAWVGLTEDQAKAQGIAIKKGHFPWTRLGPGDREQPRRRLHQAAVRRPDPSHPGRRHRRHACGRHDRRGRAGHRDGRGRGGHRQDHPSAPDAGREHRHGGGNRPRHLHRRAAAAQDLRRGAPAPEGAQGCGWLRLGRRQAQDAAGAVEALLPVAPPMSSTRTWAPGFGRMDELAFADIDADMAEGALHGVEEHQVAGLQVFLVDGLVAAACSLARRGSTRPMVCSYIAFTNPLQSNPVSAELPPRRYGTPRKPIAVTTRFEALSATVCALSATVVRTASSLFRSPFRP